MPLPKKNRLSLRFSKDNFTSGQKFYSRHFIVIPAKAGVHQIDTTSEIRPVPSTPSGDLRSEIQKPKFAILVSKKTAKKAHDRNKIRRLTSSAIQNLLSQFPIGQYLILPKSTLLITPFPEIESDLLKVIASFSPLSKGDVAKPRGINS